MHTLCRLMLLSVAAAIGMTPSLGATQSTVTDAQIESLAKLYRDARVTFESRVAKADAGDTESQFLVGAALYDQGVPGIARDRERGIRYLRLAAAMGHAEALAALGLAYEQGRGVVRDYVKASDLYVAAGRKGNWRAQFLNIRLSTEQSPSGDVDRMGALELPEDAVTAFNWYLASLRAGSKNLDATTNLGRAYAAGHGTERNPTLALIYSAGAAARGSAPAKSNVAKLLPEFRRARVKSSTNIFIDADSRSGIEFVAPKGKELVVIHQQEDGWTSVLDVSTFKLGYVQAGALSAPHATIPPAQSTGSSSWPARPQAVKGSIRCNTNCRNGDCYRTYSDGRRVRFQAKQVWDGLNNSFTWDAGGC